MPTLNRNRSQLFKVISGVTHYMGKEGSESEAGTLYVGSILVATVESNERRTACTSDSVHCWGRRKRAVLASTERILPLH
jgi:hypothetical protein